MKKISLFLFLFVFAFAFLLAGCTKIEFESNTLDMKKGTSEQLSPIVKGKGDVEWKSSNELVVTVKDGLVTAVGVGQASVTATIKDKEASVLVTVTEQMPTSLILRAEEDLDFYIAGETYQFEASILPKNADQSVTYTSTNTAVATVDENGLVTVISAGQTKIIAASVKDSSKSNEYLINTKLPDPEEVIVSGDKEVELEESITLSASILPAKAIQAISWSSSDNNIASVDSSGVVTGYKVGKVNIVAKSLAKETVLANYEIEVIVPKVQKIEMEGSDSGVFIGSTTQLGAVITPELAPQDVTWSSSDDSIATVDENGLVSGIAAGQVFITATSVSDNTKSISVLFDVKPAPARPNNNVILIDPYFEGLKFDSTTYLGFDFVESYNLFRSLDGVTAEIKEDTVIYFKEGDITGECEVKFSGVKIYGPNKDINPLDSTQTRANEGVLLGTIKFSGNLENIEINGIGLGDAASIVKDPTGTFKNFKFINNASSADSLLTALVVIDLATNNGLVNENIIIMNNAINGLKNENNNSIVIRGGNIKNILINNNKLFVCSSSDYAEEIICLGGDFDGTNITSNGYGINGKVEIINNTLTSSQSHDVEILAYATEATTVNILNNNFDGKTWQYVSSSKVAISGYKGESVDIHVDYNIFYNGFRGVLIATNGVSNTSTWTATVNYNLFDFYDFQAGYVANRLYDSGNIAVTGYNAEILLDAKNNLYRDSQSKNQMDTSYGTRLVGVTNNSKTSGYSDISLLPTYTGSYSTSFE